MKLGNELSWRTAINFFPSMSSCFSFFLSPNPQGRPAVLQDPLPLESGHKSSREWELGEQRDAPGELDSDPDTDGMAEVLAALSSLRDEVEQMRCPLGTAESPARVCKDLQFCHPHLADGKDEEEV